MIKCQKIYSILASQRFIPSQIFEGEAISVRKLKEYDTYVGHHLDATFSDFYDNPFEPLSAYIPKDWRIGISDYYSFVGPNKKLLKDHLKIIYLCFGTVIFPLSPSR